MDFPKDIKEKIETATADTPSIQKDEPVGTQPHSNSEAEQVEVDLNKPPEQESTQQTVNITDGSFLDDLLDEPTKLGTGEAIGSADSETGSLNTNKSVAELREEYIKEEEQQGEKLDVEDFEMIADFLIEAMEVATSTGFRWWALDSSDAPYEMTVSKKNKLKKLLAKILIRYAVKFPLIWVFVFTMVLAHITPFMKAKEHRKKVLQAKKNKKKIPETASTGNKRGRPPKKKEGEEDKPRKPITPPKKRGGVAK